MDVNDARILVVDDEPPVVELIKKVLIRRGFRSVEGTTEPTSVVSRCRLEEPDLVLLDLNMPGKSGFDLLEEIGAIDSKFGPIPIIVLTGERGRQTRMQALDAGARDYIVKPFDFEVVARIRNLLEARLLSKELVWRNERLESAIASRTEPLEKVLRDCLEVVGRLSHRSFPPPRWPNIGFAALVEEAARRLLPPYEDPGFLGRAAVLRDLGNIAVDESILAKPGPLDDIEWEVVKTHPHRGAELLESTGSPFLALASKLALEHQERWDGTGYPAGLRGQSIATKSRLVALCDAVEAMLSERPYRPARTSEEIARELRDGAGTQFDPELTAGFLEHLPQLLKIRKGEDCES